MVVDVHSLHYVHYKHICFLNSQLHICRIYWKQKKKSKIKSQNDHKQWLVFECKKKNKYWRRWSSNTLFAIQHIPWMIRQVLWNNWWIYHTCHTCLTYISTSPVAVHTYHSILEPKISYLKSIFRLTLGIIYLLSQQNYYFVRQTMTRKRANLCLRSLNSP